MKILLSTDTVGGVWDYTLTLARELRAGGHAVLLAVVGRPDEGRLAGVPEGVRVEWRDLRLEWMPDAEADVEAAGCWLAETARAWGAEVVHLNQMAYTAHAFGAPTLVVVHSDVLSWFSETLGCAPGAEWHGYAASVARGIAAADVVVTPTAYQSALTQRHFGRAADRVIHNGAPLPPPPAAEPREPVAISAGRAWDEAKGMAVIDRAVALLGPAAPPVHLFGDETAPHGQRAELRHLTRHGRAERAELDGWMRRAELYVGASLYEPFGLAPLEAALNGCALLLSDIGSFRELWDGCAEFFPRGDAAALASALQRLAGDPERRVLLAEAAGRRARERYSSERFAQQYLAVYEQMRRAASAPDALRRALLPRRRALRTVPPPWLSTRDPAAG